MRASTSTRVFIFILFPLALVSWAVWWDKYEPYYRNYYPEHPLWAGFLDWAGWL